MLVIGSAEQCDLLRKAHAIPRYTIQPTDLVKCQGSVKETVCVSTTTTTLFTLLCNCLSHDNETWSFNRRYYIRES